MTTCLVVDDHPAVAAGVRDLLLAHGYDVVGPACDGAAAVALAAADPAPDCALVDYRMPRLGGVALIRALRAVAPAMAIVIYSGEVAMVHVGHSLEAGAAGLVLKDAPPAEVLRALDAACQGLTYVDAGLTGSPPSAAAPITQREAEVLGLLAAGCSYADVAARLGIGEETARSHYRKACVRLGAKTRAQAVAIALRQGLIG